MIRTLLAFMVMMPLAVMTATADPRSLYTVRDIAVDERAETVIAAQQNAFAAARLAGLQVMLERITLSEDLLAAEDLLVDQSLADRLAAAVDVQEEIRGGGRYRGILAVVFNRALVRQFLTAQGVAFVDRQAPFSLAIPIVEPGVIVVAPEPQSEPGGSGLDPTRAPSLGATEPDQAGEQPDVPDFVDPDALWRMAWGARNDGALAHYATTDFEYDTALQWADVQEDVLDRSARRAVIGVLQGWPGSYTVEVSTLTPAGRALVGITPAARDINEAAKAASRLLDEAWKEQSVVRSGERTSVEASVFYTSLAEWNSLRGALSRSPLVSSFRINAIASDGAVISFAYAGDVRRLIVDLRQRGVALDVDPAGWVLTSAVTATPAFEGAQVDGAFEEIPF